ncbi:hypothetical protein [Capnocytophaga gingivalis]|jgi:hypothetical protein|uniref:hypothetical protein n=1 Tax=Capnocytophaga gingivalis TaxID=1017 RepID=UPI00235519E0|nr:hypothetical protein [Capnocytophaga gingivalis]
MKKEASFLNKLKLALALSTLFFIISMIPFALANKEEVTDSYKMGFILDLVIPFLLSFTFFTTLLPAEKYIENGIRFYLKFFTNWFVSSFIILFVLKLFFILINYSQSFYNYSQVIKYMKETFQLIFVEILNLTNIGIGIICALPLLYVYRKIILEKKQKP